MLRHQICAGPRRPLPRARSAAFHVPASRFARSARTRSTCFGFECCIDALDRDRLLFFHFETVHAHDDRFLVVDLLLVFVGGVLNFLLHVSALDRLQHPAKHFDLAQIFGGALFDFIGQGFDVIRSGQRIDRLRRTGFIRDDLLRAQRDARRLLGGQRQSFIERIGVQAIASRPAPRPIA